MFSIPTQDQLVALIKPPTTYIHSYHPINEIPSFYQDLFQDKGWKEAKAYMSGYIIEEERECSIEEGKEHYIKLLYKKIDEFQSKIHIEESRKILSWFRYMEIEEDSNIGTYEKEYEYQSHQKREYEFEVNIGELAKEIYKLSRLIEYVKID